jgi:hypothetical protein
VRREVAGGDAILSGQILAILTTVLENFSTTWSQNSSASLDKLILSNQEGEWI